MGYNKSVKGSDEASYRKKKNKRRSIMKKLLSLLLTLLLVFALVACNDTPDNTPDGKTVVRLGGMTGPTSIGMAKLLADDKAETAKNDYVFTLAESGADIRTKLIQGELDIAAIPANLAANLYKATNGEIQLLAINTLGVVSILENGETVTSFADLKGKTVYAPTTASGAIPHIVFKYFLSLNGMSESDLTIDWVGKSSNDTRTMASVLKQEGAVVLAPQPVATVLLANVEGARTVFDLNEEWQALDNGAEYITGVTVVRKSFAEANPEAVADFLAEYETSIAHANEKPTETAAFVNEFRILEQGAALIARAIPACNIEFLAGAEMKTAMKTYIDLLFDLQPQAFGGAKPDDGFYYIAN